MSYLGFFLGSDFPPLPRTSSRTARLNGLCLSSLPLTGGFVFFTFVILWVIWSVENLCQVGSVENHCQVGLVPEQCLLSVVLQEVDLSRRPSIRDSRHMLFEVHRS